MRSCPLRILAPALVCAILGVDPATAQGPSSDQAAAITEALDWFCADWIKPDAPADAPPRHDRGVSAGWRETRSAAPAVGPILIKGGAWGRASVVRVAPPAGHRCSISMQLSSANWSTDTAHAAVTAWTARAWPTAFKAKDRGEGPRMTRETVFRFEANLSLTLQESPEAGAQPNVFITVSRQDGGAAI